MSLDVIKQAAKKDLASQRQTLPLLFTMAIDPKFVLKDFWYQKLIIFNPKKVPLLLHGENHQPGGDAFGTIFKNGDDLRQDILTLQIIQIMDKIWLENNLDLAMTPYKVLGTNCEQGFVEFVGNTVTLAKMQYIDGLMRTFSDDTVYEFFLKETKKEIQQETGVDLDSIKGTTLNEQQMSAKQKLIAALERKQ